MPQEITHTSFEQIVGETVDLQTGNSSFQANVKTVSLLRQNPEQEKQPFSVELQAFDDSNHGQQLYQVSHPDLGTLSLFLVPLGPEEDRMLYEIIFN